MCFTQPDVLVEHIAIYGVVVWFIIATTNSHARRLGGQSDQDASMFRGTLGTWPFAQWLNLEMIGANRDWIKPLLEWTADNFTAPRHVCPVIPPSLEAELPASVHQFLYGMKPPDLSCSRQLIFTASDYMQRSCLFQYILIDRIAYLAGQREQRTLELDRNWI